MRKPVVVCVVGTRPDAIKTAPVVLELRKQREIDTFLVATGQHREMLDQALAAFGLEADRNLELMKHGQSLAELTARALTGLDGVFRELEPNYVVGQGDTTTTFVASVAAFYRKVSFGHVEAGLRTHDLLNPFPEEFNRRAAAIVATHHFAPTRLAADNLRHEGVAMDRIRITGNTGIDAVRTVAERFHQTWLMDWPGRVVLLTTHRRENWGEPQRQIARAARELADRFEDVRVVVPLHKNPDVRDTLTSVLTGHPRIDLIEPPDYAPFVKLMQRSTLILTDSGGVQEEAPAFGIPVLVLRETTERPEGVSAGAAKLVGTNDDRVLAEASVLLSSSDAHAAMARVTSPYGDGQASVRIAATIAASFGIGQEVQPWE